MINLIKSVYKRLKAKKTNDILEKAYKGLEKGEINYIYELEESFKTKTKLFDEDREFICILNETPDLKAIKHYYEGEFYGWNLYIRPENEQDLKFLQSFDNKGEVIETKKEIIKAFNKGIDYYVPNHY